MKIFNEVARLRIEPGASKIRSRIATRYTATFNAFLYSIMTGWSPI